MISDLRLRDGSQFIHSGYRPPASTIKECYRTWSYLHNETVNIFSHVAGSLLFFVLPFVVLSQQVPPRWSIATYADRVVCCIYFVGVAICFALSTVFHTLLCHQDRRLMTLGMQLDFQGVLLLMWGATVPLIYYGFVCDPHLRWVYWSLQTISALGTSAFTLQPGFNDPSLKLLRAKTFGAFALSSLIPIVHAIARYGWHVQVRRMRLYWVLTTLTFNITGATAYAFKFPEAIFPRKFDLFGSSHQILHIAVIFAGVAHMFGILQAFDFLHGPANTCPTPV
ncbi:Hly-III related protein [Myriangium duriaei CBS 260.36]|uniref:Hly-III related protein n=1 Tax=Myriangium duriaei CBS 260.36 TaxID=1168546 RepID=A0A9P4IW68_9PEZI|nr:Hly-III related protein [Myriangium duriaei CBS 260.36]